MYSACMASKVNNVITLWLVQAAIFKRAQMGFHWWAGVVNNINKGELN